MKSAQDLMMYASLFTICSLCLVLSDRTVAGKTLVDDSVDRNNLDLKNLDDEKPSQNTDDKRKWSEYATWGKRKWDGVAAWGKRWSEGLTSWGKRAQDPASLQEAKRQWNQFVTWGKRNGAGDKRKDWSSFANTWGKRGKWANFNTWGKRDVNSEAIENAITEKVLNLFDDNGDHGLNRDEMLAFVNWLRTTGGDEQVPDQYRH